MKKQPKGVKGMRRRFRDLKNITASEIRRAMAAASKAIDEQAAEILALKRILIAERAQLIFYTDRCVAYAEKRCLDVLVPNFLDLEDEKKEPYIKRAVEELSQENSIVPHETQPQQEPTERRRGIILPGDGAVN